MRRNSFYILSCGFTFSTLNFKFYSTFVEDSLQIALFMQNKPNFRKSQMNVNKVLTKDYENNSNWTLGENEPKTNPKRTQTNPKRTQLKPIKCQNKANSNPKQTQFQRRSNDFGKSTCANDFSHIMCRTCKCQSFYLLLQTICNQHVSQYSLQR